jgi:hypothetical protein
MSSSTDAQVALVRAEHGVRARQRLEHEVVHLEPARVIDLQMFFAEVTAPVMMWTSASSRTPTSRSGP